MCIVYVSFYVCSYVLYSRSKAGGYQSRLSDSQLSPPPPTLQPNGDGYEYMAKGVGPMFNHQTLISEDR